LLVYAIALAGSLLLPAGCGSTHHSSAARATATPTPPFEPATTKTYTADVRRVLERYAQKFPKRPKSARLTRARVLRYAHKVYDHVSESTDEIAGLFPPPRLQRLHTRAYQAMREETFAYSQFIFDVGSSGWSIGRANARLMRAQRRYERREIRALRTLARAVGADRTAGSVS
jgi:hypothetical protein